MNALRVSSRRFVCVVASILAGAGMARAADIITRPAPARCEGPDCQVVELFAGIEAGKVEAKLIPRDAKKARVFLTNKTKGPLNVRLPAALAGKAILAQFQGGALGGPMGGAGMMGRGANNAPQTIGISPNNRGGGGGGGNQQNGMNFMGGVFNIPPEKTAEFRVDCCCLEYGKPNPRPVVPYELVKAETVANPATVALLVAYGKGEYSQSAMQAAAWHLANDMSWEKIESLKGDLVSLGVYERRFSRDEIKDAKTLVAVAEKAAAKTPAKSIGESTPSDDSVSASNR
jgi:hypothetical protein